MVRLAQSLVVLCLLLFLSGCMTYTRAPRATVLWAYPHATEATLEKSSHEHFQAVSNVAHRDARALVNDFDLLFMTDRPTRLTHWHDR